MGRRRERGDPLFFTGPSPACVSSPPGWVPLPCALACVGEGLHPGRIGWRWPAVADCGDDRAQDGRDGVAIAVDWVGLGVAEWGGGVGRCRWPVDAAQGQAQSPPRGQGNAMRHPQAPSGNTIGLGDKPTGQAAQGKRPGNPNWRATFQCRNQHYTALPICQPQFIALGAVTCPLGQRHWRTGLAGGVDGSRACAGGKAVADGSRDGAQRKILRSSQIA